MQRVMQNWSEIDITEHEYIGEIWYVYNNCLWHMHNITKQFNNLPTVLVQHTNFGLYDYKLSHIRHNNVIVVNSMLIYIIITYSHCHIEWNCRQNYASGLWRIDKKVLQCNLPNPTPTYSNVLLQPTYVHCPKTCISLHKKTWVF